MSVNEVGFARYKHKLPILILLYLLSPPSLPRQSPSSQTPPRNSQLLLLTPFTYSVLFLHTLFILQSLSDYARTSMTQNLLANPLPPPFKVPRSSASSSQLSVSKRLTRLWWRTKLAWNCLGLTLVKQAVLTIVLLGFFVQQVCVPTAGPKAEGWNRVVELPMAPVISLRGLDIPEIRNSAKWIQPFRDIVLLELLSTILVSLFALSPILRSLDLFPRSIRAPSNMLRRGSRDLLVPTSYLLPRFLAFSLSSIQIVQTLLLVLSRSTSDYRLVSFTTVVIFYTLASSIGSLLVVREALERDFERVLLLVEVFSRGNVSLDRESSSSSSNVQDRDRLLDELETESCAVCFEDDWTEPGPSVVDSFTSRCFLTNCGHTVHASCLYEWFQRQSFCPACHKKIPVLES